MGADCGPLVLMEEERLKLNVLDPGKETGAGTMQLGVCETSAEDRQILIRWDSFPLVFYATNLAAAHNWGDVCWKEVIFNSEY